MKAKLLPMIAYEVVVHQNHGFVHAAVLGLFGLLRG